MDRIVEAWHATKGWRTLAASLAIAVAGVLQSTDWSTLIPPDKTGPVMVVIGVAMALLRMVTDGPVGRK
jgi:xanthine/uracil permease